MSKAITGSLITLTVLALLQGCSKEPPATPAAAPETPAASSEPAQPHPLPTAAAVDEVDLSGIAKAEGGKTIAEVFAEKDQLADQTVTIRGKVVKTNAGIMGRNWIHVRDGSGAENANDLTVTTSGDLPKVGDTVIVSGQISLNKDFGMGYEYPVIIEDGEVTVE